MKWRQRLNRSLGTLAPICSVLATSRALFSIGCPPRRTDTSGRTTFRFFLSILAGGTTRSARKGSARTEKYT